MPFYLLRGVCSHWMCQDSNKHKGYYRPLPFSTILEQVLGLDKLQPECPEWMEGNLDVQVAEHSADGLGQFMDVWNGYRCSCWLFLIQFWQGESDPLHKGGSIAILFQCFLHMLLLLDLAYT